MNSPDILRVTDNEAERAIAALVAAFIADPLVRWLFPDPRDYLAYFPRLQRVHFGRVQAAGGVRCTADFRATAVWFPPGAHPDGEAIALLFGEAIAPGRLPDVMTFLEQMSAYEPAEPHWYLRLVGVDPPAQRLGYGAALLDNGLADCDRERRQAYLEATSPASIRLYEREGFEVLAEVQTATSPPIWPMLRKAR